MSAMRRIRNLQSAGGSTLYTCFTFCAHAAYHRDRTRQENALRACSARADRFFRHLPKYRPPPATTRPHAGSTHGRSGTPGAVAAAAHAPQTTNAATLRQQRSHFRRFCCKTGCLILTAAAADASAATTLRASPTRPAATPALSPSPLGRPAALPPCSFTSEPHPRAPTASNRAQKREPRRAPNCTLPTATALPGAADAVMTAVEAKPVTAEEKGWRWRRRRRNWPAGLLLEEQRQGAARFPLGR